MRDADSYPVFKKKDHPTQHASCLSFFTFWYTVPLFRIGRKREFTEFDISKPVKGQKAFDLGSKMALLWSEENRAAKRGHFVPNLTKVMFKMVIKDVIVQGLGLFLMEVPIRLFQPLFLGLLIRYFSTEFQNPSGSKHEPLYFKRFYTPKEREVPVQLGEAYVFGTGVFLCSLANVLIMHPCMMAAMNSGLKLRVACCSLLYRKTLALDLSNLSGSAVGTVINLMSNDVSRFDIIVVFLHYLWIAPFQMLLCLLFIYYEVGIAAVFGIATIVGIIPLQAWFGNRTSSFRLKTASRTDERVRQMYEIIQGMQVIKMYTWEYAFVKQIRDLRRSEMIALTQTSYIRGAIMSFIMFTTRLAIFVTILAIIYKQGALDAERIFVIVAFYQILRQTMTLFFPYAIAQIAETNVAITRIKKFLFLPLCTVGDHGNLDPNWQPTSTLKIGPSASKNPKIVLSDVSAKIETDVCLQNVSLEIQKGQLTAVIGQVGSGKSSLLNTILGEVQPTLGNVVVEGTMSYASQEPWLFPGSVRQNILFGEPFNKKRYQLVIMACALVRDFELFPFGDHTIVGERGTSLSGGQRARINLARAVYKEADIYLLDDPLSAVDAHVGKHLFDVCINQFLSGKIVVLVTHQLQFLSEVNKVVLMDNGTVLVEGSYHFLESTEYDFAEFLRNQLAVDAAEEETPDVTEKAEKINLILQELHHQSTIALNVIDIDARKYKPADRKSIIPWHHTTGWAVYNQFFKAGGNCCFRFIVAFLFLMAQVLATGGDYFLSKWIDVEETRQNNHTANGTGLTSIVMEWSTDTSMLVYSGVICLTIIVALTRSFVFFIFCMRASMNLHDRMFQSIISASMEFFNKNPSGNIMNRFSKDMGTVDELLPNAMLDSTQILLNLAGSVVIVLTVDYYLAVPTVVMLLGFYLLRREYLKTSQSTKRLEGTCREPVFAHLNSTVQGLATIRCDGAEAVLTREFDYLQDEHSSAWFMCVATARAFGFWLDLIATAYIGVIVYSFLLLPGTGSDVGLAITTVIGLTGIFQWGMKQSTEVSNQIGSVERIFQYIELEHESDLESEPDRKPPPDWPSKGKIEFKNLELTYKLGEAPVLKNLNFLIPPGEKVGIVGRTGAGKSSLIAALFRLARFEGSVVIDEINTTDIGLHDLRSRISIIPQEPVLFCGTLRYNMDPFNYYDDATILNALTTVKSKSADVEGIDCLEHHISEGGVNISIGERQLICLARAVLRNNQILVLDEATANIDPKTDRAIQTTIRQNFERCTVLTIAHRLHTVMDSDRILVMEAGEAAEFHHPHVLLQRRKGIFLSMVDKTGKAMAKNLKAIAKDNYMRKFRSSPSTSTKK